MISAAEMVSTLDIIFELENVPSAERLWRPQSLLLLSVCPAAVSPTPPTGRQEYRGERDRQRERKKKKRKIYLTGQ